ncbi:hypothetical protein QBC46DRAFT_426506 [Diplogelasinospora grovesii]|uniref:Uncharacterized protein n=1 Tax=Diplogelasinospora grovesii TaxID=303347 RepID=A0AAN6MWJ5_9PEZI|nr:hypothetical protein QBC46DRAFT_426506 [Diplogelasinospora grovesii]
MATSAETNVGAIVNLTQSSEDQTVWEATQTEVLRNLPPGDIKGRKQIAWSFGPVNIVGYVDTDTFEVGVSVTVAGINVGAIYGNLKDGVILKINLLVVKGQIKLYLKNGNEVWINLSLKITFDGSYSGDYKIVTI